MKEKKVNIIIPVYNSEKYIADCIESIQNQSYNNVEVILIDDGSTDNSAKIIKKYTEKNTNIKYFWQENAGAPVARNFGIKKSDGDYIMFLDSDDILEENSIQNMVSIMEMKESQLVLGNYEEIDEQRHKIKDVIEHDQVLEYENEDVFKCATFVPYPGNKMYSNKVIKENNIEFANVKIGQDLNFYTKYLAYCKKVVSIPDIIAQYRIVNGGISRSYTLKVLDIIQTMEDIKKAYQNLNLVEIYKRYISIVELVNYNAQLRKTVKYKEKIDRKLITLFMKKYASKIEFGQNVYYGQYKNVIVKFWLKVKFSFIYNSNFIVKYIYNNK